VKTKIIAGLSCLALIAVLGGCSKNDSTTGGATGRVSMHLTDAPGDFEQVNLVITEVSIRAEGADTSAWETLKSDSATFDLLQLRNGVFTQLAIADVPAGHYSQIRLLLGAGSTVVVDGVTHPLIVPSGMQSGLKLVGNFDVPAGGAVDVTLDFDASRSIVLTGSDKYILKPVVRVIVNRSVSTGAITGHLLPEGVAASVFAIAASETLQTTSPAANGHFTLSSLAAGSYSVAVHPDSGYRDTTLTNVSVTAGSTTDVGDVQLTANPEASAPLVGRR